MTVIYNRHNWARTAQPVGIRLGQQLHHYRLAHLRVHPYSTDMDKVTQPIFALPTFLSLEHSDCFILHNILLIPAPDTNGLYRRIGMCDIWLPEEICHQGTNEGLFESKGCLYESISHLLPHNDFEGELPTTHMPTKRIQADCGPENCNRMNTWVRDLLTRIRKGGDDIPCVRREPDGQHLFIVE